MARLPKTSQLHIRVIESQNESIQRLASEAGMDMSAYVLSRVMPEAARKFADCVESCLGPHPPSYALAELEMLVAGLTRSGLQECVAHLLPVALTPYLANYIAAIVEYACGKRMLKPPSWTRSIPPLEEPVLATTPEKGSGCIC